MGAGIYLNQFDNVNISSSAKDQLKKLAAKIDLKAETRFRYPIAFFQALEGQMIDKTDQEKKDMIYNLSNNTGDSS